SPTVLASCGGIFDYEGQREKLEEYEQATGDPSFWEDNDRAQRILRDQATLKKIVEDIDNVTRIFEDGRDLYELGREESDTDSIQEAWVSLERADAMLAKLEFRRMLGQ